MQFGATAHFSDYLSELGVEDHDGWDWRYRRGFVERIQCSAADWERYGDEIVQCQPVREVELTTSPTLRPKDIGRWVNTQGISGGEYAMMQLRKRWFKIKFTVQHV